MIYRQGDLVMAVEPIIIHGCNAKGVMGSGVAKAIRAYYPDAMMHTNKLVEWDYYWDQWYGLIRKIN